MHTNRIVPTSRPQTAATSASLRVAKLCSSHLAAAMNTACFDSIYKKMANLVKHECHGKLKKKVQNISNGQHKNWWFCRIWLGPQSSRSISISSIGRIQKILWKGSHKSWDYLPVFSLATFSSSDASRFCRKGTLRRQQKSDENSRCASKQTKKCKMIDSQTRAKRCTSIITIGSFKKAVYEAVTVLALHIMLSRSPKVSISSAWTLLSTASRTSHNLLAQLLQLQASRHSNTWKMQHVPCCAKLLSARK